MKKLDFELSKKGDLYYFEGPFLSHFTDERGNNYFMNWVDLVDDCNRWILFRITIENLDAYFTKRVSLLQLIQSVETGTVYMLDIDGTAEYKNIYHVSVAGIPDEYLPKTDSYFDESHAEPYAGELEKNNRARQKTYRNAFMEKAVKKLFAHGDVEFISMYMERQYFKEPDFIDELAVAQSLYFPLIVHYHKSQDDKIRALIVRHSNALSDHVTFKSYLSEVSAVILNERPRKALDMDIFLGSVLQSTIEIVKEEPKVYLSLYNQWFEKIQGEYKGMDDLSRLMKNKRKLKQPK